MTVALILAGLILALVEEFQAGGKSLLGWAVVLIGIALVAGKLG